MLVQDFLRRSTAPDPLADLTNQYAIKVNDYPADGIVLLNYNAFDSPKKHPITIECRSLILDRETFDVISRKFDRFFNFGEFEEFYHDFNFDNCHIMSKEDGSLVGVYYNPHTDKFSISTRSLANAELTNDYGFTWYKQILMAGGFKDDEDFQLRMRAVPDAQIWTFLFEYVSPYNRIVTPYTEPQLVFIGARRHTGEWMSKDVMIQYVHYFDSLSIRLPEFYDKPKNIQDVVERANELANLKEGFVLWDPDSNKRLKIKSDTYVLAHTLRGETKIPTDKNVFAMIFSGEADEFLTYFPEYETIFVKAQEQIFKFEYDITAAFYRIKHITDLKSFAQEAIKHPMSFILFAAYKNNKHPIKIFYELPEDKRINTMLKFTSGIKDE